MDLNGAFEATSKIIFGRSLGTLDEFETYLSQAVVGRVQASAFSRRPLFITSDRYAPGSRFLDYASELGEYSRLGKPLDINQVKDIDSLMAAVSELMVYSGNKVLGNSQEVQLSDNVFDSMGVLHSSMVTKGRYIAHSYMMRESEFAFGSTDSGNCSNIIRCFNNYELKRCFECCYTLTADSYFCFNVIDCADCMFTFNVRSKRNMIGNIQLEKARYLELKKKLVDEMAAELAQKKRLGFSIIDMLEGHHG